MVLYPRQSRFGLSLKQYLLQKLDDRDEHLSYGDGTYSHTIKTNM